MSTFAWLVLVAVLMFVSGRIGFLAGREAAESRAAATIADLRASLRRATGRYLTDDPRRPE
jgi:hypothetical protein